jgi:Cu-Zn family superoxide dismutase
MAIEKENSAMKQVLSIGFVISLGAFGMSAAAQTAMKSDTPVKVDMHDGTGKSVGTISLSSAPKGVAMKLDLMGLKPGVHAIHVHQTAKCDGPDFTSAGGHFNPMMKHHGFQNPEGPHAGDIPNFTVDGAGKAATTVTAPGVILGDGDNSMFANGGTAIVIHAGEDDGKSDPAGNAGARVACGVVVKK